ncbi:MAG: hypothetical protein QMC90_05005, partial [Dehalococcoidales bacterium]|nr:hypothetical protein [Dehalococcoidales bacterium]
MKKKMHKILGVSLTVALVTSLMVAFSAPVAASPGNNTWEALTLPSTTGRMLRGVGGTLGPLAQNCDGTALYAYDSEGAGFKDLFKSVDGGRTWTATGF